LLPRDWFARGLNQFTGAPLTGEQIQAREEYADKFFGWARNGQGGTDLQRLAPNAAYMQTQDDAKGGFFVTDEMENAIIQLSTLYSAIRGLVDVRTITRPSLKQPANMQGATAGWVGETETRSETDADDAAMLQWFLMQQYAKPKISNDLLDDADVDMEAWLDDGIARAFATNEGASWITGSGVKAPRGIHSYTIVANASWAWGKWGYIASGVTAALTDTTHNGVDAMIDVIAGTGRPYLPNATWLMNRLTQAVIRKIKDTAGQYIWQQSISADTPSTLLGYPVETDDNMPSIAADAYPIAFGDWKQAYRIVEKAGTAMLRDPYTESGFTKFYTTRRIGGGAKNFEALKLLKIAAS
jgi:HK97 family phage major capsid protein